jgi:hypothetical protein
MIFFSRSFVFFKKFVSSGVFFTNRHLLVLDGHGNHVTLKTISQTWDGLRHDHPTIPHITLSPTIKCIYFKPFKTTFRKVKEVAMSIHNHMQVDKITLVKWVDKVMEQSLTKNYQV